MKISGFIVVGALACSSCAPTIWDRPDTTQVDFNIDNARCSNMARMAASGGSVAYGSVAFVATVTALSVIGTVAQQHEIYRDCMQGQGYIPRSGT